MLPRKFEPVLFSLILSGMMCFVVSGISTLRVTGLVPSFMGLWISAWLTAWLFAFPIAFLAPPLVRRIVRTLLARE